MMIRKEISSDIEAISEITAEAFRIHPVSRHTEQFIVNALRKSGALTLSLVAEIDGRIVGHIAFSPVGISDGTAAWYGIGPLSVLPAFQKQGVGKALMTEGLALLKTMGGKGCALVGDPAYYPRFGFRNISGLIHEDVPAEVFFALPFDGNSPQGTVTFHEGFGAKS